jgi:hypothetical protein
VRLGVAGEKSDFFSILLAYEDSDDPDLPTDCNCDEP